MLIQEFKAHLVTSAILLFVIRNPGLLHASFVLRPFFGKVQDAILFTKLSYNLSSQFFSKVLIVPF